MTELVLPTPPPYPPLLALLQAFGLMFRACAERPRMRGRSLATAAGPEDLRISFLKSKFNLLSINFIWTS